MLSMMTGIELNRALMTIKQQGGKVYSNVFARLEPMKTYDAVVTEESVAFVEEDHGVNRFYFYTIAFEDLKAVTENISIPLTLDIVTRDESEYQSRIYDMGFTLLARMRRLVNKDITDIVSRIVAAKNLAGGGDIRIEWMKCHLQAWHASKMQRQLIAFCGLHLIRELVTC